MNKSNKQNLITAGVLLGILGVVLVLFLSSPRNGGQMPETTITPESEDSSMRENGEMIVKNLINTDRTLTLFDTEFGSPLDLNKYKDLVGSEIEQTTVLMDIKKNPINFTVEGVSEVMTLNPKYVLFYYKNDLIEIAGVGGDGSNNVVYKRDGTWRFSYSTQMDFSCENFDKLGMDTESTIVLKCFDYTSQTYRK